MITVKAEVKQCEEETLIIFRCPKCCTKYLRPLMNEFYCLCGEHFKIEQGQERGIVMTRGICPNCGSWADFGIESKSWQVISANAFGAVWKCPNCYNVVDGKNIKKYEV
jgi:hypothetical protein